MAAAVGRFRRELDADPEAARDRLAAAGLDEWARDNLLKYLAGPEVGGGNFLSDTRPESKAEELRGVSDVHYKALHA